jgi:2-C-methyl-D-erythritol 2,4-cyclodiphosphate synthase
MAVHIDAMKAAISKITDTPTDRIGIKAKTGEGTGPIGHGEAIAARVVVLVYKT